MNLRDAYLHVKTVRKIIAPNPNFWKQLFYLEKLNFEKRSLLWDEIDQKEIEFQQNQEEEEGTEREKETNTQPKLKQTQTHIQSQQNPVEEFLKNRTVQNSPPTHMW